MRRPARRDRLWGGTFHAVAHRLVADHAEALGLPAGFSVLDPADATDLMDLLRHDHGLPATAQRFPRGDDPGRHLLPVGQHRPARRGT